MRSRRLSVVLVALAVVACGRSGSKHTASGIEVGPLPAPPTFSTSPVAPDPGGELAVVASRPQGVVRGEVRPTVTFSKPMVALGSVEEGRALAAQLVIAPPLAGEWRWLGSATVEFVPARRVPLATRYTVTVPQGLRAGDGTSLAAPHTFGFETPRPEIQGLSPSGRAAAWLTPRQTWSITFNQAVKDLGKHLALQVGDRPDWPVDVKEIRLADEKRPGQPRPPPPPAAQGGFEDRRVRYEVTPTRPLPLDTQVVLRVLPGLQGVDGPLTLDAGPTWEMHTYGPFSVAALELCPWSKVGCPSGPARLRFSNPPDVASLKGALTVTPAVDLDWDAASAEGETLWLPARFRPGTRYHVAVAPAARDGFGQPLQAAFQGDFTTSDLPPTFDLGPGVALLEAKGDGALPVSAANVKELHVQVVPLDVPAMARYLSREEPARDDFFQAGVPLTLDLSAQRNASRTAPLPLRDLLAGKGTTLFALRATAPGLKHEARVVGELTDLAVHAKLGAASGAVWVTRLSDGKPVPEADLALYDRTGAQLWTGKTGPDGLAPVPGLAVLVPAEHGGRWAGETPFALVSARVGDDLGVTLSTWAGGLDPSAFEMPTDWEGQDARALGGVFPERGIYRPGETVHLKGIARLRRLGKLATPGTAHVAVRVTSARGKEIHAGQVDLTRFGTWSTDVALDKDAPLGSYQVSAEVMVGGDHLRYGGTFRVEEYRAPQFRVDVLASQKELTTGEALHAEVLARYLFGGGMPGADVRWTATRESIAFEPPGNPGFAFGPNTWWWDDGPPVRSADVAGTGAGPTDSTGLFVIDAGKLEATAGRTWRYTVEAEVTDVNRQRIANRASVTVHPAAFYAGIRRRATGFAEAGKADVLEVIAAAPDGRRRPGAKVEVTIKRREWRWIRKKGVGDRWVTQTEVQEEQKGACSVETRAEPVECSFTPPAAGLYVAEAAADDGQGHRQVTRMPFYVTGAGWVSWQREDTDRVDLVADRTSYEPGQTARIMVKSPFPEAEAIVTVEREGVLSARHVALAGSAATLDVPLTEESIPNVFVSVLIVRGRVVTKDAPAGDADPGRPQVRVGYVNLTVEKKAKRLAVEVTPDSTEKRPRDRVKVDLRVTDWRGKGVPAELTVWAVDEGVLRLTGYQVPDPVELIHPPRGVSVRMGESLIHLVERTRYGEKGGTSGGGGGDGSGAGFRSAFKTTVLFAPEVRAGADGRATVAFELPDNLTTYRIMAVAVSADDRMGKGESAVAVARPLMALPALPRVARAGDRFEAGVVVHAPGGKIRAVEVKAEASGIALEGEAVRQVKLDGKPAEVRFAFKAPSPGTATLRFSVTGGGERDGVEQKLPVLQPVEQEATALYADTRSTRREALAPPGGARPGVGGLEVTVASTALGGFAENMRQLVQYPYGCAEQLSSRLVPFIALRELQGIFGLKHQPGAKEPDAPAWVHAWLGDEVFRIQETDDPDEVVRRTVKVLEKLQDPDGGYRYWPTSTCSGEWVSSYVVLALGRAADLGYPVDRTALARGQGYLADTVAAGRCTACGGSCVAPGDVTRVFALYALARTHAPRASYYGELSGRADALPLFARAMLADAMAVGGGDRGQARTLLQGVLNHARETAAEVHFEEADPLTYATAWSSDTRTTGIVLGTLADVAPEHPFVPKIAAYLGKVRRGDGTFRNTQEAAFALMGLAEVVRTREKAAPDFTARVTLGDREIATARFAGRSTDVIHKVIPMAELQRSKGAQPLVFARDGAAGILYYGAILRYAPGEVPRQPLERGLFVQRWIEPYEGGGQIHAARAGDLVRVRVRIGTPQERHFVAIEVPVPAGLEIVDTSLASTARAPVDGADAGPQEEYDPESAEAYGDDEAPGPSLEAPWAFRFWSPFNHEERRDDRLVLFADDLPPGVHVASFVARATTPGTFVLPPAHAEEMYTPEVFGRSDGGAFEVRLGDQVAGR
jgi:uncharacterized protein YfaS (alpha-2-macroglobulin family)